MSKKLINKRLSYLNLLEIYNKHECIQLPISEFETEKLIYPFFNKNLVLLVINEMCVGIFLTINQAKKIPFIDRLLKTNMGTNIKYFNKSTYKFISKRNQHTGCRLIHIDSEWDIDNWNYPKLCKLPLWIDIVTPTSKNDSLWSDILHGYANKKIDFEFLTTMGYEFQEYDGESSYILNE